MERPLAAVFGDYRVRNFAGASYGEVDLVEAPARSVNTVYVPLGERAGLREVVSTAAAMGTTADMGRDDGTPAISLGITAVRPLDPAAAFATLAAGGVHARPRPRRAGPTATATCSTWRRR